MEKLKVTKTSSSGYAIGPAFVVRKKEIIPDTRMIQAEEAGKELEAFKAAVAKADQDLEQLGAESEIFAAHREILNDPMLHDAVEQGVQGGNNAQAAVSDAFMQFIAMFEAMEDDYMRERAADMKDVMQRLIMAMQGVEMNPFAHMSEPAVVVAEDLVPSDTANMDFDLVLGFVTETGGDTSHVAIIARNRGIPCLTGVKGILEKVETGTPLIVDAEGAEVIIEPEQDVRAEYQKRQEEYLEEKKMLEVESRLPSVTKDGKTFELCANVGNLEEIRQALTYPVDGIGLFRTEFLYMEKKDGFPSEEEQFEVYKEAAKLCGGKELTIRTLDIGGDKGLDYFEFPEEENPFLGYRAIRICLDKPEIFKNQLRALLRASVYGNIRIMYPMLICLEELDEANRILEECKKELKEKGIPFNKSVEVGMMMETPAAVLQAEDFAKRVDFFSIGTNDLTQYLLAVDRGNDKIASLYDSFRPAVVRAIGKIIDAAHAEKIKAGMCGEFAGDFRAAELLLGLGLDEYSMSPARIARVKKVLRESSYEDAVQKSGEALKKCYAHEVTELFER